MRRPYWQVLGSVFLIVLAGGGCAPQLDRMEAELRRNTEDLEQFRVEQQELSQSLERSSRLSRIEQDSGFESEAQKLAKIDQLANRLNQLMQLLEDNTEFMRSLSARVDLLATRAGVPTLGEYNPAVGGQNKTAGAPLPEEGRAIFQAAMLDRDQGNVDLARDGFQDFLDKYPNSEQADDALYWLGDLAYGERNFESALSYFQQVLGDHAFSELRSACMLKAALCLQVTDQEEAGRHQLQELIDIYPDSSEAALARERLASGSP
ncbi:MAG: tol-pal system protein YbgF [bacterium]